MWRSDGVGFIFYLILLSVLRHPPAGARPPNLGTGRRHYRVAPNFMVLPKFRRWSLPCFALPLASLDTRSPQGDIARLSHRITPLIAMAQAAKRWSVSTDIRNAVGSRSVAGDQTWLSDDITSETQASAEIDAGLAADFSWNRLCFQSFC